MSITLHTLAPPYQQCVELAAAEPTRLAPGTLIVLRHYPATTPDHLQIELTRLRQAVPNATFVLWLDSVRLEAAPLAADAARHGVELDVNYAAVYRIVRR